MHHCQLDQCPHREEAKVDLYWLILPPYYSHTINNGGHQVEVDIEEHCIGVQRLQSRQPLAASSGGNPVMGAGIPEAGSHAALEYQQMTTMQLPDQDKQCLDELQLPDANSNLVQKLLSNWSQQDVHIIHAGIKEIEVVEDKYNLVQTYIEILKTRVHTEKHWVDAE